MTLSPTPSGEEPLAGVGHWRLSADRLQTDAEGARLVVPGGLPPGEPPAQAEWLALLVPAEAHVLRERLLGPAQPWALVLRGGPRPVLLRAAPDDSGGWRGLAAELPDEPETPDGLRARDEFVASISHELRTPLNAILGFARMVRSAPGTAPVAPLAARIEEAGQVMLRVVNDLLDLSQLEAGRLTMDLHQTLELPALMARVAAVTAGLRQDRPVRLYATLDPACPARLVCDAGRIEQVMLNLASNALKFTEQGMVVIGAKLRARHGPRATVRLSVSDTGVGIDFQHLERLGRPFERAAASRRSGTGLGLAVVRRLLALHGSRLKVASVAGGGTICWFDLDVPCEDVLSGSRADIAVITKDRRFADTVATLVRAQGSSVQPTPAAAVCWVVDTAHPDAAAWAERGRAEGRRVLSTSALPTPEGTDPTLALIGAALAPVVPGAAPGPDPTLEGLRVLVVDDNLMNQQLMTEMLQPLGVHVSVAGDARTGLALARVETHDLVLLDMNLPDADGLQLAAALRALPRGDLPALAFVSAHVDASLRRRAAELGALAFLSKPFGVEALQALLRSVPRRPAEPAPPPLPSGISAERLRALFAQIWPGQRDAVERAADGPALRHAVHALRGSLAMLGERTATDLAAQVEQGLLDGRPPAELPVAALLQHAQVAATRAA